MEVLLPRRFRGAGAQAPTTKWSASILLLRMAPHLRRAKDVITQQPRAQKLDQNVVYQYCGKTFSVWTRWRTWRLAKELATGGFQRTLVK
ncbi:hypothetical protein NDU88_001763 [Pleurodeles waltl]|uniref:Uncharacterized protein n=1 Tax=Pleurodeles waltl TaxID=8319 RepID=A0AAV7M679_PLEWA|nr:hypothetical protein NDU88_001763 [Pleurodeles waltl]